MPNKNFRVRHGLEVGEDATVTGSVTANSISLTTYPTTSNITEGSRLYYTTARANTDFDTRLATKATTNLTEGTNLYYTDARSRAALSGGTGVTYSTSTGEISIGQAVGTASNVQFNDIALTGNISDTGALQISTGANGNLTLAPNGTGVVVANTGLLQGPLRAGTAGITLATPTVFSFLSATTYRGMAISNAVSGGYAAARTGLVIRSTPTTAAGPRGGIVFENARTDASGVPAALQGPSTTQIGDYLGEIIAGGYLTDRYVTDALALAPLGFTSYATETWSNTAGTSTNVRAGTGWALQLQPSGVNLSTSSRVTTIDTSPQNLSLRNDTMSLSRGKTSQFTATGCSISGSTLTIGTVAVGSVAVGTIIQNSTSLIPAGTYIISGSGSSWTLNQAPGDNTGLTIQGWKGFLAMTTAGNVDVIPQLTTRGPVRYAVTAAGNFAGGSTYTPASTVSNAISATINSGTGGFTVALTNLIADSTTGGHYQIFVSNTSGSNQSVTTTGGVVNISHNLANGAGMMLTIYIVGAGAFCEHIA